MSETKALTVDYNELRHDEDGTMLLNGRAFSGAAQEYYPDGGLASETKYLNGIEHGLTLEYHQNGRLAGEVPYIHGRAVGLVRTWYPSGNLEKATLISKHSEELEVKAWDEAGNPVVDITRDPYICT